MRNIILLISLTISSNLFAFETKELVTITNDTDNLVAIMYVQTDVNNDISGFEYKKFRDNVMIESTEFPAEIEYAGIVLERVNNKDVVILRGINLTEMNGGEMEIDFLFNGISGARGHFPINLDRTANGWELTQDDISIKQLELIANKRPGFGIIGIKKILIKE